MARFSPIANAAAACGVLWSLWCVLALRGVGPPVPATPDSLPDETAVGQDYLLGPDFLPLQLGNRWIYEREDSRFQRTTQVKVEIIARPILEWTTYYVFNQLPFVPGLEGEQNVVVRYDQDTRRFLRLIAQDQDREEIPLFPVGESADAIIDQSPGHDGLPVANRLSYLTCPDCEASGLEMIFDRGLGIVEVGVFSDWGSESYRLKSALVNGRNFGDPMQPEAEAEPERPRSEVVISRADPVLSLELQEKIRGSRSVAGRQESDRLLSELQLQLQPDLRLCRQRKADGLRDLALVERLLLYSGDPQPRPAASERMEVQGGLELEGQRRNDISWGPTRPWPYSPPEYPANPRQWRSCCPDPTLYGRVHNR